MERRLFASTGTVAACEGDPKPVVGGLAASAGLEPYCCLLRSALSCVEEVWVGGVYR